MRFMWLIVWLGMAFAVARGQDQPPALTLPKPPPPSIPPPKIAYVAPPPSKWDGPLLYSQLALAGAGTGATAAAHIARYRDDSSTPAITSVGVVGLAILLERAYAPTMSGRAKKWVSIANFATAGLLAGFMTRDVDQARTTLQTTAGVP